MTDHVRQHRSLTLWLLVNVFGAAIYLWLSSKTWIDPELRGVEGASRAGDAVIWGLSALPIFLVFVAANFVWTWRRHWRGQRRVMELLIFVPWVIAFGVDRLFG